MISKCLVGVVIGILLGGIASVILFLAIVILDQTGLPPQSRTMILLTFPILGAIIGATVSWKKVEKH
jgi:NhaP-type Na+/H+ or K+/H+ antiporter